MKRSFSDLMSLVKKPMGYPLLARRESNGHGNGWFHRVHDEDVAAAPTRHVLCETTGECGVVQLGGLEPPTSGSTERSLPLLLFSGHLEPFQLVLNFLDFLAVRGHHPRN